MTARAILLREIVMETNTIKIGLFMLAAAFIIMCFAMSSYAAVQGIDEPFDSYMQRNDTEQREANIQRQQQIIEQDRENQQRVEQPSYVPLQPYSYRNPMSLER